MTEETPGLNQARAARKRAEEALVEVEALRPEVKEVAKQAVRIRTDNHFRELIILSMRRTA